MTEVQQRPTGALAVRDDQTWWTQDQLAALDHLGIDHSATEGDLRVFLTYAQRTGLDPFARQIYLIGRYDRRLGRKRWTIQGGIDGFRIVAQRSGQYLGQTPAEWCGPNGVWTDVWLSDSPPAAARAGVRHADWPDPLYAVATWGEYAPRDKDGKLTGLWAQMPALMLHKCAEALALRRAFPHDLSGMYSVDELAQAGNTANQRVERAHAMPLDHLVLDALMAQTLQELQAVWREASAAGVLDNDVADRETGEVHSMRDWLMQLSSHVSPAVTDVALPCDDDTASDD